MTEREMFEQSFKRPSNYFLLSGTEQWAIDKRLGILDWSGADLDETDKRRFDLHYNLLHKEEPKKKLNSPFVGVFLVVSKIGLKLAKFTKVILAAATFASYSYLLSWKFAILIMLMIAVHESGHLWAMKKRGIKTKGFYFIPFFGGGAVAEEDFKTRDNEAFIAIMGPIWGFTLSLAAFILYFIFPYPLIAAVAAWWALINLFNLLPINPLDGGRILKSVALSTKAENKRIIATLLLILSIFFLISIIYYHLSGLLFFFAFVGCLELLMEIFGKRPEIISMNTNKRIFHTLLFLVVGAALYLIIYFTQYIPGAKTAMDVLK